MSTHISPILVHLLGQCEDEIATYAPVFGGCNQKYWIIPELDCKKTCFFPAANEPALPFASHSSMEMLLQCLATPAILYRETRR